LWMLGACGGGDVKMFAAVGAWIGWGNAFGVFAFTLIVVGGLIIGQAGTLALTGQWRKLQRRGPSKFQKDRAKPIKRLITFALPLTIATALWLGLRFQLAGKSPRYGLPMVPTSGATNPGGGRGK